MVNFEIFKSGQPRIYYVDYTGNVINAVFDQVNVYNGQWTHLALVCDRNSNTLSCYVNGSLAQTKKAALNFDLALAAPAVGGDYRNGNGQYFKGQLRSVAVYSTVRTAAEIKTDMNKPDQAGLMAMWDLSTQADRYTDQTNHGYDLAPYTLGSSFRADRLVPMEQKLDILPKTFEAWLKLPEDMGSDRGGVILGNYDNSLRGVVNFEVYSSGKPRLYCTDTSGVNSNLIFSTVNVCTGSWVHLAIVRDTEAGKAHCYVNGVLAESLDMSITEYAPSTELYLGGDLRAYNTMYFKGQLRSVTLHSTARTAEEIQGDMSNIRNGVPLAVWDTRAHCSRYVDLSGNGNDAGFRQLGLNPNSNETFVASKKFSSIPKTVEAWIHFPKTMDSTRRGGVILGSYEGSSVKRFNVEITTKGAPRLYFQDGNGTVTNAIFSDVNVYTGKWLHLTLVYDKAKGEGRCYVNGKLEQTLSLSPGDYAISAPMVVGADYRGGNEQYFKGQIHSVAVYSDVRTEAEIAQDKSNMGKDDPLAYWDLKTYQTDYTDLSGHGYHLNRQVYWISDKEPVTGYDYTFAVIGDTQKVTYYDYQNGTKNLKKIYSWILSQKESQNIQYVMGLGDITEKGTIDAEWDLAVEAIGQLDGKIPYSLVRGNHDNSEKMNQYLKDTSKISYSTTYEGSYDKNVNNTWRTIEAGSEKVPYLIFTLDYGINDSIMAWAGKIIEDHPHHNVIITTHAYLFRDGTTLDSGDVCPPSNSSASYNNGDHIWTKFASKYENIMFVLSGHDPCSQIVYRQDAGDHGNVVTQMLIDPQGVDVSTPTGAVALLHFSKDGRTVDVEYYATIPEKYFMTSNQFSMTVDVVDTPDHIYSYTVTKEPTATATGTLTGTCTICGQTVAVTLPKLNTTDYSKSTIKAATCTATGLDRYIWKTDTYGSFSFLVTTAAKGHSSVADPAVTPTCTTPGKTEGAHCTVCNTVLTAQTSLGALGHEYSSVVTVATCTAQGYTTHICSRCSHTYKDDYTNAKGHSYTYEKIDALTHKRECENCHLEEIQGHSFAEGYCICGEAEVKEPALDATIKIGHSLNLASDISVNFGISKSLLTGFDMSTVYMESTIDLYEGEEYKGTTTVRIDPVDTGYYYYFTLTGLTAVQMNDSITSVFYGTKDGQPYYSGADVYKISDYAYSQLSKTSAPDTLKTLCANLLRYGAKAQIFKNYRTTALADSNMTEAHRAYLSDTEAVTFGNTNTVLNDLPNAPIAWAGKGLDLDSKVCLKFIFNPAGFSGDLADLTLKVSYKDLFGEEMNLTLTDPQDYSGNGLLYAFTLDALLASELREVVSVQIFQGTTPVSATLRYSADTYGNNKKGDLLELCKALIAYSDSAKAYFLS